jgi:hypothetical protein
VPICGSPVKPHPQAPPEKSARQDALALHGMTGEMNEHLPEPLIYAAMRPAGPSDAR